jgi:glutaredoxin 3
MEGRLAGLMTDLKSPPIRVYTRKWCGFCFAAKRLFNRIGVDFEEIPVDGRPDLRRQIAESAGNWPTVPMVFIGDRFVGGYTEVAALHRSGELQRMLPLQDPPAIV